MKLEQLDSLFHLARELPEADWERFARQECGGDAELEATLLRMLRHQGEAFAWFAEAESSLGLFWEEASPATIGPYRVLRVLGRGGMGTVYLAEREGDGFHQTVAIKCMRREGAEVLRRFLAERRILSRLEHPGIARLLDGGHTEDGEPYLVMEYVAGRPLVEWAEGRSRDEKLRLFLAVGEAVEYAHRNLVVHRDLKPSNILVTAAGQPKLLDFGIAKLLDLPVGEATQPGAGPLTPLYAAPEQLHGEPVTTLTDVYGLGELLFELLTGRRPEGPGEAPPRGVSRDLGHIACKALEAKPEDRYASVGAMLEDVRAFLAGRAVKARGPSLAYRGGKFARRHWIGILFALTLTVVTGGLVRHAQREARERESAEQVLRLMVDLFQVSDPDHPAGRVASAREVLERALPRLRSELASQPAVLADVLEMGGRLYGQLGDLERASQLLEESLAERRRAGRGAAHSLLYLSRVRLSQGRVDEAARIAREGVRAAGGERLLAASCALALAEACERQGRPEAESWYREALRVREAILPAGHPQRASALAGLGRWLVGHGRVEEGERLLDEAFR